MWVSIAVVTSGVDTMSLPGTVVHISESLEGGKKWMKVVLSNEDGYK
jgi:hypothetical protein